MKHQYAGDINDYRKYGLLRCIGSVLGGRMLVAWMLTPDDGTRDGGLRGYLGAPAVWRRYDPGLYDLLRGLYGNRRRPRLRHIEASEVLPGASYYARRIPDGMGEREAWRRGLVRAAQGTDLVFLDPDTGIQIPSRPPGRRGFSAYAAWDDIQAVWEAGCSVLVYQHFGRTSRGPLIRRLTEELRRRTGAPFASAFSTPRVLFLLATQERHAEALKGLAPLIARRWGDQIRCVGAGRTG
ncbi:MAG: hypothetical protein WB626_09380 [Bacteroidota bacterium]